jgi:hypothetical protein
MWNATGLSPSRARSVLCAVQCVQRHPADNAFVLFEQNVTHIFIKAYETMIIDARLATLGRI